MRGSPDETERLARIAGAHHRLAERAGALDAASPPAVLDLGAAVLFHGELERQWLFARHPLLDPAVIEQLTAEHDQLALDLETFDSLWHADPESHDVPALSGSLLSRLRDHIARDERVLYQVPGRLALARPDAETADTE